MRPGEKRPGERYVRAQPVLAPPGPIFGAVPGFWPREEELAGRVRRRWVVLEAARTGAGGRCRQAWAAPLSGPGRRAAAPSQR